MFSMSIERDFFFTYAAVKKLKLQFFALKDLTVSLKVFNQNICACNVILKFKNFDCDILICQHFGEVLKIQSCHYFL